MELFFITYVWPAIIIVAQSVLVLVALLIFTAFILWFDRKVWAAVMLRRGPNVVGPWGCCNPLPISSNSSSRNRSSHPAPTRVCSSWLRWFPPSSRWPHGP